MARKAKAKTQPPASPLANPTAVRIMAALAGGSRQLGEIAQVSYNKINTLIRASTGNADFLYEVYRSLDSHPDFRKTLESTWSILDALRELGKLSPTPALEMSEVEARMFDNIHQPDDEEEDQPLDFPGLPEEEKNAVRTQADQARQGGAPEGVSHSEQPTTPTAQAPLPPAASHPNPAVRAFFRNKQLDKPRGIKYGSSIIDDMFTATDKENDDETPIVQAETGDVMSVISRNPGGATTAITDPFESNLRQMPDQFDSDNKRF